MKNQYLLTEKFSIKEFIKTIVPSYFFPAIMSWLSGWFMQNKVLMASSYTSIAIPSLIATIIVYIVLWKLNKSQIFFKNKFVAVLTMLLITICIANLTILIFKLQVFFIDILISTFLGTFITAWKETKIKK